MSDDNTVIRTESLHLPDAGRAMCLGDVFRAAWQRGEALDLALTVAEFLADG
ncbi:MAG: hypothetical protein GYB65_07390 [Chloroflexi bacterium]|nr:hypothetical protein [Chloroflexota bacterium]